MKRVRLADGIFLNIIESDKFKTDYFDFNIILPLREETASYAALLPLVLKRGCEKYPAMADISKRLDYLYSTGFSTRITKRGEAHIIGFTADFLRESLIPVGEHLMDDVFDIIRNIIFKPLIIDGAFKKEYVESEKKNLIDAIKSLINNKNAYAMKKCHEAACAGSNFAVGENGKQEIVESITSEQLYDFYKKLLSGCTIEMFYTGMCAQEVVVNHAKELVLGIERKELFDISTEKFERTRSEVTEITEEMEVAQGKLAMCFRSGYTVNEDKYTAYSVFNSIYGASPTSKLFENVREKLSLCYYCRSVPDSHKGIMTVVSGIEVENRDKAVKEILAQLDNAKNGDISDEEILNAKKSLSNSYRELFDSAPDLCMWYLSRLIGGSEKTVEEIIDEINKVTKQDLVECAKATELDTIFFLKGTLENGGDEE